MASYYGFCRSNYFSVKDIEQFKIVCEHFELEIINNDNKVGFFVNEESGIPTSIEYVNEEQKEDNGLRDEKYDEDNYDDVFDIIAEMLLDDEVMVVDHIGNEKLRFLTGYSSAYNNKGQIVNILLSDIYEKAKELGSNITYAEY